MKNVLFIIIVLLLLVLGWTKAEQYITDIACEKDEECNRGVCFRHTCTCSMYNHHPSFSLSSLSPPHIHCHTTNEIMLLLHNTCITITYHNNRYNDQIY